jgi:hypothetical protein
MMILLAAGLAAYFTFADQAATRALTKNRTGALLIWLFAVLGVAVTLFAAGFFVIRALLGVTGEALVLSLIIGGFLHYRRVRKARPATSL